MSYGMAGQKEKIPSGYKKASIQNYTPQQLKQHEQLFRDVAPDSYLSKLAGGDQSMFAEIEAPALRQFTGLQGNIASRFSGMGGLGARKSSGFQNEMTGAASDFAQQLQANRQGLQRQAISDLHSLSNQLLSQNPFTNTLVQKQQDQGFNWGGLAGGAIGGIGGFFAGGPAGAFAGGKAGYDIGSGFSGHQGTGTPNDFSSFSNSIYGNDYSQQNSAQGYEQEFRNNPAMMGY